MKADPNLQSPHHSAWIHDACFGKARAYFREYCGTTKYTSVQTFLCVRSVLLLFHCDRKKKSDQIALLRQ